jgi:hypothetical protein
VPRPALHLLAKERVRLLMHQGANPSSESYRTQNNIGVSPEDANAMPSSALLEKVSNPSDVDRRKVSV